MQRQSFFLVPLICLSSALWAAPATVNVEVLQDKLDHPWALAFLPDNHGMLITLRGGEIRRWQAGKGLSAPLSGVPEVWAHGQGGLMDVALAPDFAQSRRIWLSYSEVGDDGTLVAVAIIKMVRQEGRVFAGSEDHQAVAVENLVVGAGG